MKSSDTKRKYKILITLTVIVGILLALGISGYFASGERMIVRTEVT